MNTFMIETRRMSWGEWRASAIKLGSLDRAIDGPYCETQEGAIIALKSILAKTCIAKDWR